MFSASFDALATSGTALKLQVSRYSTSEAFCGEIHRKLYQASPKARQAIYKGAILPKLEYCASVWDPHQLTLQNQLETTQKFAARVITKKWKTNYANLLQELKWNTLKTRRKTQKLKMCYNILNRHSCIPSSLFTPHPSPSPRLPHTQTLFLPYVSTLSHFFIMICGIIYLLV